MAFDEGLAQRVREKIETQAGYDEKKMFGGRAAFGLGALC